LIPRLNDLGEEVIVHAIPGVCPRVMNAPTYLAVNEWLVERFAREGDGLVGYESVGEALVHSTAEIADDACLVGPVLVGPSVLVRSRATVVGPTSVGSDSRIEAGACVSRSAVWSGCVVGEGAFVDQSILADNAVVPRGRTDRNALRHGPARVPAPRPSLRSDDLALSRWRGTSQTSPRPEARVTSKDRRAVLVQPGHAGRGRAAETRRP